MPSTAPPQPPMSPAPGWQEIGRPSPGEAQDWATWVAPLDRRGNGEALYRSLVLADGAIAVTVELHAVRRGGSGPRTVHRGRCGLPEDPGQTAERVSLLLGAADRAAAKAVQAHCGAPAGVAAGRARPAPHRTPDDALQDATWGGGASAAPHEREDRPRERARQEAATAA